MSNQTAPTSKPKVLKMTAPGTLISRPYFFSFKISPLTSLTVSASPAKSSEKRSTNTPTIVAEPGSFTNIPMIKISTEAARLKRIKINKETQNLFSSMLRPTNG
ncbi:hypothetical protein OGAPHI_003597 [Ogataea philodendri]|uniref:Uncharacterized protein n=1 Tax=Ogataea philodendri TaxID=1378263 RepID=A0A9P8P4J2_9ASCO|nr:uncharacterized protein OGAPHI_003597 [Ogataea philodendri]KAH3665413.1 hypothetical protein OGAPHI_003597 [Ogataea philodendri]